MCLGHREGVPLLSIHLFCVLTLSHFPLMKPLLLSFRNLNGTGLSLASDFLHTVPRSITGAERSRPRVLTQ